MGVEEDVRWGEIAMEDVPSVAQTQSDKRLSHPSDSDLRGHTDTLDEVVLGRAHGGDVGGEKRNVIVDARVEHSQDVWALKCRQRVRFTYDEALLGDAEKFQR